MKHPWKNFGLHRPDEMERYILLKAQRNSYLFLVAALFVWSLYESYRVYTVHSRLNLLPCLLLVTAALIQSVSQLILTRSAVKDDEDSYETGPLIKLIVLVCAVVGVTATIAAAMIFMGTAV